MMSTILVPILLYSGSWVMWSHKPACIRLQSNGVQEGNNGKAINTTGKNDTVSSPTKNGTCTTAQFSLEKQWRLIYAREDGRFSYMHEHS